MKVLTFRKVLELKYRRRDTSNRRVTMSTVISYYYSQRVSIWMYKYKSGATRYILRSARIAPEMEIPSKVSGFSHWTTFQTLHFVHLRLTIISIVPLNCFKLQAFNNYQHILDKRAMSSSYLRIIGKNFHFCYKSSLWDFIL